MPVFGMAAKYIIQAAIFTERRSYPSGIVSDNGTENE